MLGNARAYVEYLSTLDQEVVATHLAAAPLARHFLETHDTLLHDRLFSILLDETLIVGANTSKILKIGGKLGVLNRRLYDGVQVSNSSAFLEAIFAGITVWSWSLRSLHTVELLNQGRMMWRELCRGYSMVPKILGSAMGDAEARIFLEKYWMIPAILLPSAQFAAPPESDKQSAY